MRRGGCAIKKRCEATLSRADGVVAHKYRFGVSDDSNLDGLHFSLNIQPEIFIVLVADVLHELTVGYKCER